MGFGIYYIFHDLCTERGYRTALGLYLVVTEIAFSLTSLMEAILIMTAVIKLRNYLKCIYPDIEFRNSQFYLHVAVLIVTCFFSFYCFFFVLGGVNASDGLLFFSYFGFYFQDFLLNLFAAYLINSF